MARRRAAEKREIIPDPKFGSIIVTKFMNVAMLDGKKSVAEGILNEAFEEIHKRYNNPEKLKTNNKHEKLPWD